MNNEDSAFIIDLNEYPQEEKIQNEGNQNLSNLDLSLQKEMTDKNQPMVSKENIMYKNENPTEKSENTSEKIFHRTENRTVSVKTENGTTNIRVNLTENQVENSTKENDRSRVSYSSEEISKSKIINLENKISRLLQNSAKKETEYEHKISGQSQEIKKLQQHIEVLENGKKKSAQLESELKTTKKKISEYSSKLINLEMEKTQLREELSHQINQREKLLRYVGEFVKVVKKEYEKINAVSLPDLRSDFRCKNKRNSKGTTSHSRSNYGNTRSDLRENGINSTTPEPSQPPPPEVPPPHVPPPPPVVQCVPSADLMDCRSDVEKAVRDKIVKLRQTRQKKFDTLLTPQQEHTEKAITSQRSNTSPPRSGNRIPSRQSSSEGVIDQQDMTEERRKRKFENVKVTPNKIQKIDKS